MLFRSQAEIVLEAQGISKSFGGIVAAQDLDFVLKKGTITALVGPNGAGKTTVFNLLTGNIIPDSGTVRLRGKESHPVLSARSILLLATFGTAGIALALPVVATAAVFTFGLLREGITTIQALLGR